MKKILIFILTIVVISVAVIVMFAKKKDDSIKVLGTATVADSEIRSILQETGIVKPQVGAQITIGARATGAIDYLKVQVGAAVKKGELIARIDSRAVEENMRQTELSLKKAQAQLDGENRQYPVQIKIAQEKIRSAKAQHDFAKNTLEREKKLLADRFSTRDTVDKLEKEYAAALAELNSATLDKEKLEASHATEVKMQQAEIDRLKAQLSELQVQLTYTRIIAPIDGVVTNVAAEEGETVVAGLEVAKLITILKPELLEMWIYIDETDIGKVAVGMPVEYSVDTYGDKTFHGTIARINPEPVVKENIVYYLAIVTIPTADALSLRPEMTTHVRIVTETKKVPMSVPNGAIKWEKGKNVVYKVLDEKTGKVERIEVTPGIKGQDRTEVTGGLKLGDVIATKIVLPVKDEEDNGNKEKSKEKKDK